MCFCVSKTPIFIDYLRGDYMSNSFYSESELLELGFKSIGNNVFISRKASIYGTNSIVIGNNVRIDDFCILSGKIVLGDYVHIAAYTALFGGNYGIEMKDYTVISSRCVVYAASDDYSGNALISPMVPEKYSNVTGGKVIIEKYVVVGTGTSIMPSVIIHEGTAIGSMSFVNKSLDGWGIYVGIPCKKIKDRSKKLLELEKQMHHMYNVRER